MQNIKNSKFGFSLIELLVATAIGLILLSGAIGFFLDYLDKRSVSNAVDELKLYFQKASSEAGSGNLGGCDELNGWRITSVQVGNLTTIYLQASCTVGTPDAAQSLDLTEGVELAPDLDLTFKVLHGGVEISGGAASQVIIVSNETYSYSFSIYREGRFDTGGWL